MRTDGRLVHGTRSDGLRTRDNHALAAKGSRYAESAVPVGLDERLGEHAPSKQSSLFFHYRWRMQRAIAREDVIALWGLVKEATEDYMEHTNQKRPTRFETDKEAIAYLLTNLVGVSAERAAIEMRVSNQSFGSAMKWARDNRRRHGRDPETGEMREMDARTQEINDLRRQGWTQQAIGTKMGLTRERISQILAGR